MGRSILAEVIEMPYRCNRNQFQLQPIEAGPMAPQTHRKENARAADVFRLDDSWVYKITVLADLVARKVSAVVAETSGLNLSQWRVLAAVADEPGRTSSEVVAVTPMDKAIVSRAVRVLIDMGLLRREASQEDGRRAHLQLTDEGEAVYRRLVEALDRSGASGLQLLPGEEGAALNARLDALIEDYQS
ncbi:winged helix-turn-helix transcriptional regulator [Parvularcula sp. ZS-1/3]|uniref:Winged helix-turn-helix transcriptional regulator n=1 Tax=Parvularcula mediterranea TaxID=2732508 RepID=A0A7Y3RL36_9PROT|nr:MarR family winged helix-turn-helix transcriptional regulator [Parvularcula mediterranea]NNU16079.1 winged helix-turn-helix transcriptional regulator [Parvularcula mediterranea]